MRLSSFSHCDFHCVIIHGRGFKTYPLSLANHKQASSEPIAPDQLAGIPQASNLRFVDLAEWQCTRARTLLHPPPHQTKQTNNKTIILQNSGPGALAQQGSSSQFPSQLRTTCTDVDAATPSPPARLGASAFLPHTAPEVVVQAEVLPNRVLRALKQLEQSSN